jgi:uncharacterized membrane protein YgcG
MIACGLMSLTAFASQSPASADEITLYAQDAIIDGAAGMVIEPDTPPYNIGGWKDVSEVYFEFTSRRAGPCDVVLAYAKQDDRNGSAELKLYVTGGESAIELSLPPTGDNWSVYEEISAGSLTIPEGDIALSLTPMEPGQGEYLINLRYVKLIPSENSADERRRSDQAFLTRERNLYDDAGLFSQAERERLNGVLGAVSVDTGAHFLILTTDKDVLLEDFAYQFFNDSFQGEGGVFDGVVLSINMTTRRVSVDCFGELRTMVSDDEISSAIDAFAPDLVTDGYVKAADTFVDEMSALVKKKRSEYNIDAPEVNPSLRLYDFAGTLTETEYGVLSERIRDVSDKSGVDYIIVLLDESVDKDYLRRFAGAFYNQNFKDKAEYDGAYMLVISGSKTYGDAVTAPFGAYDPENSVLSGDDYDVNDKLFYYSVYTACARFLSNQLDSWQAEHIELPALDSAGYIWDYGNKLTDAQKGKLSAQMREMSEKHHTRFCFVIAPYPAYEAVRAFDNAFISENNEWLSDSFILLTVGIPPDVEGDEPAALLSRNGSLAYDKIGYDAYSEIISAANLAVSVGDYETVCTQYVNLASKALGSWVPKAVMAERFPVIIWLSLLVSLCAGLITIIILCLLHGHGMKRKVPARNYLAEESLALHYSSDRFISTHTAKRKIENESESGGGHSGSSGSGHSSRSERSF